MCYPVMRRDYLDLTKPNQAAVRIFGSSKLQLQITDNSLWDVQTSRSFESCRKRAFNRAKKELFWSRAEILPSGYNA